MLINKPLILSTGTGVAPTFSIDQSIRFNNDDNAYMSRTQDTADSKRRLTFSWWMKRGSSLGTEMVVISAGASSRFMVRFNTSDKLTFRLTNGTTEKTMTTDMVFRDVSAWYHCVWIADCTTGSDFSRLYVNGSLVTMTGTQPTSNTDFAGYGDGSTMAISSLAHSLSTQEFDGYLAEMVLIDDDALLPTSFGEFNSSGIWIPKDVSGLTFGTNGFHIDGRDASGSPVKLGDDESGNGNDFTTSGLASHDQMADSPTNNHCTWNPLRPTGSTTMSDGNLTVTTSGATYKSILGTIGIPPNSGIFYYEGVVLSHTIQLMLGWGSSEMGVNQNNNPATPKYFAYADYLGKYYSSSGDGSVGDAFENNDVIGLWIDTDNTSNNLKFYRNGTLQSTHSFDFSDVDFIMPLTQHLNGCSVTGRFASNQWTQTPSGITEDNAINTKNLGS